ncbi:MAG: hypothetical protein A3C35_06720 [Omnitrophica bacterium RIFCSPHIGHO2_02_FULL_46_11]|nr:MAG: hypothetical protein A3C35_06720 [Omnitrophica bacterium RIFCSPHIGHO2_02_FULL_46_11]OGW86727.1 MAG: hypothetical protein A3A81_08620 [Omnitrophica bacterium RIFCSPLOWO2_01_FULL_45_10b]
MESSKRTVTFLILGTLLLLLYVHEQVSIFQVSYSIERKEREIARLSEEYKTAKFNLARLRSPRLLSERMKKMSLDLGIPTDQEIVTILKPKLQPLSHTSPMLDQPAFRFLSLVHFVKEAQARDAQTKTSK